MPTLDQQFEQNKPYIRDGAQFFQTFLPPAQEQQFRGWVTANAVPFRPNVAQQDYDMRGFWRGLQTGNPKALSAVDPNDNRLHYPDNWKTPYHETFSAESQWAKPVAPQWNQQDQLVSPGARILFDDRAQPYLGSGLGLPQLPPGMPRLGMVKRP